MRKRGRKGLGLLMAVSMAATAMTGCSGGSTDSTTAAQTEGTTAAAEESQSEAADSQEGQAAEGQAK